MTKTNTKRMGRAELIWQYLCENKDKQKGNEKENKKEGMNVYSNEGNNEQEASAATTENTKSQPRQISENKRGHFPNQNF
ncbi:hypothetical protein RFI_03808 [Reticulomyxa filosa]|uniref:Uncharacterized protein n=1 Tax=Reticulomyxa filosa TaxID=46433 RepID=X6P5C6_RETFI|nr:hypothetical protein RFI_03808 [Reticulomyxa filosa]|eukprot:ETO33299.1 hypothetical protein RFI_03808 [Reticulomyxa filosa]